MAKNITLAVDDAVLEAVRRRAAREQTTVNAMVREFLGRIAGADDRSARARRRLVELAREPRSKSDPVRWDREEAHAR